VILVSCTADQEQLQQDSTDANATLNVEEAVENVFYTETVRYETQSSPLPAAERCGSSTPGFNNLNTCKKLYNPGYVQGSTYWNILDNGPGSIDYELEQLFMFSCDFSYTCIRPKGPPTTIVYAEVWFQESPSFNLETFEYDIYYYTDANTITQKRSNSLRQHFACEMDAYRNANLPGAIISEVNFFGDVLLCSGSSDRYIKASFRMALHGN
jgi:hypothetical protein